MEKIKGKEIKVGEVDKDDGDIEKKLDRIKVEKSRIEEIEEMIEIKEMDGEEEKEKIEKKKELKESMELMREREINKEYLKNEIVEKIREEDVRER